MNRPQRLKEAGTLAEREVLGAADGDGLSPAAKERLAAALGVGSLLGEGASGAVGAAKAGKLIAFKWALTLAVGVALAAAGARAYLGAHRTAAPERVDDVPTAGAAAQRPEPSSSLADVPGTASPVPVVASANATAAESSVPAAQGPAPRASMEPLRPHLSPPPATAKPSSLADEVAALEAARSALARHDASGALSSLDRYEREFPRRSLGQEAAMLRIEALLQRGDRAAALALAKRLRDADRTYEARMRSLFPEFGTP